MPSRRSLLAVLASGIAGCGSRSSDGRTPSATAVPTRTAEPYPEPVASALGTSRFTEPAVCYAAVPCFHTYEATDRPDALVVPDRERVTPSHPRGTTRTYNLGDRDLVVAADVYVAKYSDPVWVPTVPFHETTATRVIPPGGSLDRTFGMAGRGDGRYVVVERAGWGGPRGTVGMTVESRFETDRFRFGAMLEVAGSSWTPTLAGVPTERDGGTLRLRPSVDTDTRAVLEADEQRVGIPLVPETVAAHPPTNDAILSLRRDGITRTTVPRAERTLEYVQSAFVYPTPLESDKTLRLGDIRFTARIE